MNKVLLAAARTGFIACAVITLAFAFAPAHSGAHLFPWDKADHFAAFFAITTAGVVAFPRTRLIWIALVVSAAGAGIEVAQGLAWVGRDSDIKDWVAENAAIAAVMGLVVASELRRRLGADSPVAS